MFWLKQVYYGLLGLCLLALLFNFKKISKEVAVFLPIILLAVVIQVLGDILKARGVSHYFVFRIYIPIEYLLLCFYYSSIITNKTMDRVILISGIIFFGFSVLYYFLYPAAFFTPG